MSLHIVGFIFARGGSKGIPRKNIRIVAGKPLIAYSIEVAHACNLIDRVVVSTDSSEIADVARSYGAEVPFMRPLELAQDNSPEWLAWQHAIRTYEKISERKIDVFVVLPTTSPLRAVEDVDTCIHTFLESDADIILTVRPAQRNPYYNMVEIGLDGYAQLVISPTGPLHQRQAAPKVFDITTVAYVARPNYILNAGSIFEGKVRVVIVPPERALDIDTELDLRIAEALLRS